MLVAADGADLAWRLLAAWRDLLFADEDQHARRTRDPLAPAGRSTKTLHKASSHKLDGSTDAHNFRTLLEDFRAVVRNTCQRRRKAQEK